MIAHFYYGDFFCKKEISEPLRQIVMIKPLIISPTPDKEVKPVEEIPSNKLIFELWESPKIGQPLIYKFVGES